MRAVELEVGQLVCGREPNLARTLRYGRVVRTPADLVARDQVVVRFRAHPGGPLGGAVTVPASLLEPHRDRQRNFALPTEAP